MRSKLARSSSDLGQSTVELAIVLPVLLLLLFGIVDIALAVNADVTITNASREAATYAISHPAASLADISTAATARSGVLHNLTVSASYYNGTMFVDWPAGGLTASNPPVQIPVRVQVTYPWSASTIVIGQFFGGTRNLNATATMWMTW